MTELQEFACGPEAVTATMTLPIDTGEHFGPPLTIGFYPGSPEVWIEGACGRQDIPVAHLKVVIQQLRRSAKLALENSQDKEG